MISAANALHFVTLAASILERIIAFEDAFAKLLEASVKELN